MQVAHKGCGVSLETFKSHLDVALGGWLLVHLLEQRVGPDDLQRSHLNSAFL